MPRRWMPGLLEHRVAARAAFDRPPRRPPRATSAARSKNVEPHETSCIGRSLDESRPARRRAPAAMRSAPASVGAERRAAAASSTRSASAAPFHSSSTGVGPMPSPNMNSRAARRRSRPSSASANVDPITGCPANGISPPRPKMRSRMSVPGCLGRKARRCTPRSSSRASSRAMPSAVEALRAR